MDIIHKLRNVCKDLLNATNRDEVSIPIGHGYSLEFMVADGTLGVEVGVFFPSPWGGNRDGDPREPIKHYLGGICVAPGMVCLLDQGRDVLWQKGKNHLAYFAYDMG
jgi:hypothetical protein